MKRYLTSVAIAVLCATGASAQMQGQTHSSHNPAIKNSHVAATATAATGRNSFTEDQARERMAKAGYMGVSKLTKDGNGVWRGTAMRGKKRMSVGLDYKGNVTAR